MKKPALLLPLYTTCAFALTLLVGCQTQDENSAENLEYDQDELVIASGNAASDLFYPEPALICDKPVIWDRVRAGFQLDYMHQSSRIDVQLQWYAKHQSYLDRVNQRSSRYMWHIVEEIEKRGMPMEFALLPIVESAYDPFAYSHGRASGIWQFIPATGKFMGLDQNWWYDGRRDITASTDSALRLLQRLHDRLGDDWLLALAAYNSGEGNVRKAIRKNKKLGKPTDFWHLDLPRETRAYAPKLLALARIYADPAKYGVTLSPVYNESYFVEVETGSQIDLAQAANLAEIDLDELYLLNPAFNRWATAPDGPHKLLLPRDHGEIFDEALAAMPESQRITWERYTIKDGDSLSTIAQKYHTTTGNLMSVNNLKSHSIRAGKTLMIPVASNSNYRLSQEQRIQKIQNTQRGDGSKKKITYTVRSGDSFWSISRQYNVGMKQLARWNGMGVRDPLRSGQKLVIWTTQAAAVSSANLPQQTTARQNGMIRKINYRVRNGDSLALIGDKFNVSVNSIAKWNSLDISRYLKPGQLLTLYIDVTNTH